MIASLKDRMRRKEERGVVIVILALSLVALTFMIGFAVDLGTWYLRASKLQRAADVAAISAAGSLPDTATATTVANDTFARNGFASSSTVSLNVTATETNVQTSVKDNKVPTYFVRIAIPSISIQRSSKAEKMTSVPLGNPYNIFGSGSMNMGPDAPRQNFWAAISGICSTKEDGDLFGSKWDANKTSNSHRCTGTQNLNPNYRDGGFNGYSYLIDVPAGAAPIAIDVWDGQSAWETGAAGDARTSLGGEPNLSDINTSFAVYNTKYTTDQADDTFLYARRFQDGESDGRAKWVTLYNEPSSASGKRQYMVQVRMDPAGDGPYGTTSNGYSLMASVGGNRVGCDTRKSPNTCPKVYGIGAVSVMSNISTSGYNQSSFFLAELAPNLAGSTFDAYMWDPGEGAQSIEILSPNNTVMNFDWTITPNNNLTGAPSGSGNKLDVSGNGGQPYSSGLTGTSKYNDRLVTLRFTVPLNYASYYSGTDYWWKIRYTTQAGQTVTDRTTFGIKSGSSSPAHLTL